MMHFIFVENNRRDCRVVLRRIVVIGSLLMLLACLPKLSLAASSCRNSGNLSVTVSATGVNFGNYDVLAAGNSSGTGSITVSATCTRARLPFTVNYSIALSTGGSGTFTPRAMVSGTSTLQYNLYTAATLTSIWGDGSGGTQTLADVITGTCTNPGGRNCSGSQPDTVYGNIPAMQDVVAGSYADTITVTVTF